MGQNIKFEHFEIISFNDVRINKNVPIKKYGLIKDKEGAINGNLAILGF